MIYEKLKIIINIVNKSKIGPVFDINSYKIGGKLINLWQTICF